MDLRALRLLALALVPVIGLLVGVAVSSAPSGDAPVVGILVVGLVGAIALAAMAWVRQLPVRPGDAAAYGKAAAVKLALAEAPVLAGFAFSLVFGPWWPAAAGAAFSLAGLALAWPSEADRERHELLFLV